MSLFDFLMQHRDKHELAKELAALARENAALKNRIHELEHEVFWLRAKEKE